jgi:hypothetical protein
MHIKLVKKIKLDGNLCHKSAKVLDNLQQLGLLNHIDQIIAADERDLSTEGFALADKHKVAAAPFFIVDNDDGYTQVYTGYYRFLKEILHQEVSEEEEINEIMTQNSDLYYI